MGYRKIEEGEFLKMLANVGYVEGILKTPEMFIKAIGNFQDLEKLRKELAENMKSVIDALMDTKLHS